jgi:hypothetical protein
VDRPEPRFRKISERRSFVCLFRRVRLDLELVAERAFDSGLIYGRYRTR